MGYTAMTSQERAGKRRRKGAGNPCGENGKTLIPQLPEVNVVNLTTLIFRNVSERRGISMYMTNEEWEQNNQDYLKESYEKTGFTIGGYAIRKLICGGCGRVFYTTIYTKKYCHSYWCGNQANNRRQREYRQMRRQDLVCQCCGEKFTPKRADARYCSNACRQKDYRKRVTDAASAQNEHLDKRNAVAK